MKYSLSIIISHYCSNINKNPLLKTLDVIQSQIKNEKIEIIIADDGSNYSESILKNYSDMNEIKSDDRNFYILRDKKLNLFLERQNISNQFIKKWIYLPKLKECMSKARVTNEAVRLSESEKILFLDDDNYFTSNNSIENILFLFNKYDFIIGQIEDNHGKKRSYNSYRVQGTTIATKKEILNKIGGFGEWTEEYSCGVDSDFWIKIFNYFQENKELKACYSNKIATCDSYSKRWKKYTKFLKEFRLRYKFNELYNCKNYKNKKYNLSRNKKNWIENLTND